MADKEFEKWLDEVDEIGRAEGYKHSIVKQTGSAAWAAYFEDGYSPEEAYDEDMAYG